MVKICVVSLADHGTNPNVIFDYRFNRNKHYSFNFELLTTLNHNFTCHNSGLELEMFINRILLGD